jgi:hypothetical protein
MGREQARHKAILQSGSIQDEQQARRVPFVTSPGWRMRKTSKGETLPADVVRYLPPFWRAHGTWRLHRQPQSFMSRRDMFLLRYFSSFPIIYMRCDVFRVSPF